MDRMLLHTLLIVTAFAVGFAMKRGGLCAYAAALQIVDQRRFGRLLDFAGAAAWAGVLVLPLYWWLPGQWRLSGAHDFTLLALGGGALLGLGAYVNRGCVFGTFVQLVGGNLNYLATLLGVATAVVIAQLLPGAWPATALSAASVGSPQDAALIWWGGMALAALLLLGLHARRRGRLAVFVMLCIGLGGGLLFAALPGWDFGAVLSRSARRLVNPTAPAPGILAMQTTAAMVIGGILAAVTAGSFHLRAPNPRASAARFLGGLLLGSASQLIPGGNDSLLLRGLPAEAPQALIALPVMMVVMVLLLTLRRNSQGFVHP